MLIERFEEFFDDPIAELKQLTETYGIVNYHGKFEAIRARVKLSEEYLVSAYLVGLRLDTQMHIRMFQPQTMRLCLMLGRLYEIAHPRKSGGQTWVKPKNQNKSTVPFKKEGKEKTWYPWEKDKQKMQEPRPFLSHEEMSKRRAEGL